MNEIEKLSHLLAHWREHNEEHGETYREWANKASLSGNKELSAILEKISVETKKLDALFQEAIKQIG